LFGFATHVAELLEDARTSAAEPTASSSHPTASVPDLPEVLARTARVREFAAGAFGRVGTARAAAPAQRSGWRDGHRAAAAADIGRARVAGPLALERGRP
jgi:hypothetical protein